MIFDPGADGTPRFTGIHPLLAELLRATALDPWERCPSGSSRLLPRPGDEEELCHDWEDHVQPELRRHFDKERSVVADDLEVAEVLHRRTEHHPSDSAKSVDSDLGHPGISYRGLERPHRMTLRVSS